MSQEPQLPELCEEVTPAVQFVLFSPLWCSKAKYPGISANGPQFLSVGGQFVTPFLFWRLTAS